MHEGGYNAGTYNQCVGISDPIATMATQFSPEIDEIITGHTHDPYICSIPDPAGNPRLVTSSASYGHASPRPRWSSTRAAVRSTAAAARRRTTSCPSR